MSEGCFIFRFASLHWKFARLVYPTLHRKVAIKRQQLYLELGRREHGVIGRWLEPYPNRKATEKLRPTLIHHAATESWKKHIQLKWIWFTNQDLDDCRKCIHIISGHKHNWSLQWICVRTFDCCRQWFYNITADEKATGLLHMPMLSDKFV